MEQLEVQSVPVAQLREADWNANRVSAVLMKKIRRSILEFGFVENLVVRPHPEEKDAFEVLSGNHRLQLLLELSVENAPVVVVELDDARARLLAQTMNRTRGRDDPLAYRQLIAELMAGDAADKVTALLPETDRSIDDLLGRLPDTPPALPEPMWGVVVVCEDEGEQQDLLDRFEGDGRECRPLMVTRA